MKNKIPIIRSIGIELPKGSYKVKEKTDTIEIEFKLDIINFLSETKEIIIQD